VIVVALVTVVYVGISGRGSPVATPAPVAALPTLPAALDAAPTAEALPSGPPIPGAGAPSPVAPVIDEAAYRLGMAVTTRSVSVFVPFHEQSSADMHASYRILIPPRPRKATIEVARQDGDESPVALGAWPIKIGVFNPDPHEDLAILTSGPTVLVDATQEPLATSEANASTLETSGFHVLVTGEHDGADELLTVVVHVTQAIANGDPARRWVTGDDGLVGWPSALSQ